MINQSRYESVKAIFKNKGISCSEKYLILNANLFEVISYFTNGKLSDLELMEAFDVLDDLIMGRLPKYALGFPNEERLRIQFRMMEELPQTAGKLSDEEKIAFAFCVFHASCIQVYDEERDMIVNGIVDFDSIEHIKLLMEEEKSRRPEFFIPVLHKKEQTSGEFGYSKMNPICATSIPAAYSFLNRLRYSNGVVIYQRIGACRGIEGHLVDEYSVVVKTRSDLFPKTENIIIYIDAYSQENSKEAPRGFTLL